MEKLRHLTNNIMIIMCLYITLFMVLLSFVVAPPVSEKAHSKKDVNETAEEAVLGLEYERYMREVVKLLESDEEFKKKLETANSSDIKSGAIAQHLDFVNKNIRTKLDELKRNEMERLRYIIKLKAEQEDPDRKERIQIPMHELERIVGHLDATNQHTFEITDLEKLIKKTTVDLEEIDRKRREEFKKYEMEKEHVRREEMKKLSEEERRNKEREHEEMERKHKDHPKVHHPGNEEQLKDVWEEGDGLEREEFDPRTFFFLHDTNNDGYLDAVELEALFQKELDKVYNANATEDDMNERFEEMNRMREHVMNEVDLNKDKVISLEEFINSTRREEFKKDEEWDTIEDERQYTDEELAAFEKDLYERQHASDITPPTTTLSYQQQQQLLQQQQQQLQQQQELLQQQQQQLGDQKLHFEPQQQHHEQHQVEQQQQQQQQHVDQQHQINHQQHFEQQPKGANI